MTTKEFSDAFDIYLSNYGTGLSFDEYEKSLFLTQAQEQIVTELYSGRNFTGSGFEVTEELRSSLRSLVKTTNPEKVTVGPNNAISPNSTFYSLPEDVLFITFETATIDDDNAGCKNGSNIAVVPVSQDEFHRIKNNPFRGFNKRRALRLDVGGSKIEVVSKYSLSNYKIRYLAKPSPIILSNFNNEVTIDNKSTISECMLDSSVHKYILDRAVALAIASKGTQSK